MQRVETADLVKLFRDERSKLRAAAKLAHEQSERAREVHSAAETRKADLASTMEGVGETSGDL